MVKLAIIGGSGFESLDALEIVHREVIRTPFGEPSAPLTYGLFHGKELIFLPRHGAAHIIPPHRVNYRANIWALQHAGVEQILGVAAVGGLHQPMRPGALVIPDQIIDYTYGREHSYFEGDLTHVTHIDFTQPYCGSLRDSLLQAGEIIAVPLQGKATYGVTQGPRLETAAEIDRMERDGCDLVGMTGMPEAALARELDICYACCAVVANWAAGRGDGPITMSEIELHLEGGLDSVHKLLSCLVTRL